jgi:hypothetical protein
LSSRILRTEVCKFFGNPEASGAIWLIGWLCERAFRSRFTLREEGQVELWEWPNELSAGGILPDGDRQCQYYFCEPPAWQHSLTSPRGGADKLSIDVVLDLLPLTGSVPKIVVIERLRDKGIGEKRARAFISTILAPRGPVHEWHIKRSGKRHEIHLPLQTQPEVESESESQPRSYWQAAANNGDNRFS